MSTELVKVPFQGHEIEAVGDGPTIWVVIRRVCEALGIAFQPQLEKLKSDPAICVTMIVMQVPGDDQRRQVACLDLRDLPGWLAGIHPSKVAPAARDILIAYRREAYEVLADHFLGPRGTPASLPPARMAVAAELQAALGAGEMAVARRLTRALGVLLAPGALSWAPREARAQWEKAIEAALEGKTTATTAELVATVGTGGMTLHGARMHAGILLQGLGWRRTRPLRAGTRSYRYTRPVESPKGSAAR